MLSGEFPPHFSHRINGVEFDVPYFLVDGIYPPYSIFVPSIPHAVEPKKKRFAEFQEGVRKDVERVFGVLVQRFQLLRNGLRLQNLEDFKIIVQACIILHNMVVEARRAGYKSEICNLGMNENGTTVVDNVIFEWKTKEHAIANGLPADSWPALVAQRRSIMEDKNMHKARMTALVEHVDAYRK
jgi:Plant transposon protein